MYRDPITLKKHRKWSVVHAEIGKRIKPAETGRWGEIMCFRRIMASVIVDLFRGALDAEYVELDDKQRGSCLNHDLYAYDPKQGVAIIQARQFYRRAKNHYGATRKTYFLCGKNGITGEYFRHPIGAHAVRAACRKSTEKTRADVVFACQRWMWEVTAKQLEKSVRQGDILLVPEKPPTSARPVGMSLTVAKSHKILGDEIRLNKKCYTLNPRIVHTKNQHAPVELFDGWRSIRVARTATAWDFAERIGD